MLVLSRKCYWVITFEDNGKNIGCEISCIIYELVGIKKNIGSICITIGFTKNMPKVDGPVASPQVLQLEIKIAISGASTPLDVNQLSTICESTSKFTYL